MGDHNVPVKDLPAEIVDFYDAIVEKVAAVRLNAHETLATLKKEQEELALQLQEHLAQEESLRKADFQQLMGEVSEKRQAREKEVMAMLAQFQQEEQMVAEGLQKRLRESRQVRLHDFQRFLAETERARAARQAEIEDIRKNAEETIAQFREEREEMARSWKVLAEKMQERRSHKTPPQVPAMPAPLPLGQD